MAQAQICSISVVVHAWSVPKDTLPEIASSIALIEDDHCCVRFTTDGIVTCTERVVIREASSVVLEQKATVSGTGTMEQEHR